MSQQRASSSDTYYIYSTLSNDQLYTQYHQSHKDGPNIAKSSVLVKGKANIIDKHFVTPKGVVTKVDADQLQLLEEDCDFQRHKSAGYIMVEKSDEKPEVVAKNMSAKDSSAQLSASDYKGDKAPKTKTKAT